MEFLVAGKPEPPLVVFEPKLLFVVLKSKLSFVLSHKLPLVVLETDLLVAGLRPGDV